LRKSRPARRAVIAIQEQRRCEDGEHFPMIIAASSARFRALLGADAQNQSDETASVVIPRLKELDSILRHNVCEWQ
jgi:hypothetical protein